MKRTIQKTGKKNVSVSKNGNLHFPTVDGNELGGSKQS